MGGRERGGRRRSICMLENKRRLLIAHVHTHTHTHTHTRTHTHTH